MTANLQKMSQTDHFSQMATFLSTCNSLEFRTFIWISFLYVYPENEVFFSVKLCCSYLEVANCCVKQCVNKKNIYIFLFYFQLFWKRSQHTKCPFLEVILCSITSRSGSYCTAVTSCNSTLRMGIKRYCTTENKRKDHKT